MKTLLIIALALVSAVLAEEDWKSTGKPFSTGQYYDGLLKVPRYNPYNYYSYGQQAYPLNYKYGDQYRGYNKPFYAYYGYPLYGGYQQQQQQQQYYGYPYAAYGGNTYKFDKPTYYKGSYYPYHNYGNGYYNYQDEVSPA